MKNNRRILFVCLGNICRSPIAQGVFEHMIAQRGVADQFEVDSAGTGDWHIGEAPDTRAQAAAKKAGIDISHLRARLVKKSDFSHYDLILALDEQNKRDLVRMAGGNADKVRLLREFDPSAESLAVPDPWAYGPKEFDETVVLVTKACEGLLDEIL